MAGLESQNFGAPDETRSFAHGHLDVITLGDNTVGRATFEPGWKWSEAVKPIAGTESCEAAHFGYVVSGRMHVVMDNGDELDTGPGDLINIAPGHDGWVVGDEPCVVIDFEGASNYAK
jgi:mannose-6-phosphate isomerase-like protein (cupin superfamily)